jgi:hypothetical protein
MSGCLSWSRLRHRSDHGRQHGPPLLQLNHPVPIETIQLSPTAPQPRR